MKKRRALVLVWLLVGIITNSIGQNIVGKVTDVSGSPVAFANVILMYACDSVFITGAVTDLDGCYSMKCQEPIVDLLLKVTCIGYEPSISRIDKSTSGEIVLRDLSTVLDEVVVKANRPTFKMDAGALTARIQNTTLSRLGDASDVLAQLPFVSGTDGQFTVFGRGAPLIYINNNRVRDQEELTKLKSDQIKDIKVIMNPGAEYDASVGSVIKITTFQPVGEGLSGWVQEQARQRHHFGHVELANLNYRIGGLDIFVSGSNIFARIDQKQRTTLAFPFGKETLNVGEDGQIKYDVKTWKTEGGFNYALNPNHSLGMKYTFTKDINTPFRTDFEMDVVRNGSLVSEGTTAQEIWQRGQQQYLNMYYQGQLTEKVMLHFDGDYLKSRKRNEATFLVTDHSSVGQEEEVSSRNRTNSELYAGRLWTDLSLFGGEWLFGIEGSYTDNHQDFNMLTEEMEKEIPSTDNKSEQVALAPFLSYKKSWGKFSANVGLRYEYVNFSYYYNGEKQAEQSKTYHNLFPTVSLAYSGEAVSASLSYRNKITRPTYNQLRSSISYNNPFVYEGGNPALSPSNMHLFSFLLSYKDFQLSADYQHVKDAVLFTMAPFDDKPVNLYTYMNNDRDTYALYLSYAPTVSFWKPTFSTGLSGQKLEYEGLRYNAPMFDYSWRNMFQLPKNFLIVLNLSGKSYGSEDLSVVKPSFGMDLSVRKEFNKGRVRLTLGAVDILNTQRERWKMLVGDRQLTKWNNMDSRSVYLNVVYRFNSTKSNYKGDSASESEMNRL